nr:unnamed protein product [Brassica rapa]
MPSPLQQELGRLNIDNQHTWEPKRSSRVYEGAVTSVEARSEADQRRQERERNIQSIWKNPLHHRLTHGRRRDKG